MVLQQQNGRVRFGFTEEAMDTKSQIEMFARLAVAISVEDVERLVHEYNQVDTVGVMFDPTAWMNVADTKGGHFKLARAFLEFRKNIETLVTE